MDMECSDKGDGMLVLAYAFRHHRTETATDMLKACDIRGKQDTKQPILL